MEVGIVALSFFNAFSFLCSSPGLLILFFYCTSRKERGKSIDRSTEKCIIRVPLDYRGSRQLAARAQEGKDGNRGPSLIVFKGSAVGPSMRHLQSKAV